MNPTLQALLFWFGVICVLLYIVSILPFLIKTRTGLALTLVKPGLFMRTHFTFLIGLLFFMLSPLVRVFVWDKYRMPAILGRLTAFAAEWVLGVRCVVEGEENIPTRPYVMWGNHQSAFDNIFAGFVMPRRTSLLAKHQLKKIPCYRFGHPLTGGFFINRENLDEAIAQMDAWEKVVLEDEISPCVSPEGTRNRYHKTKELVADFKKGPAITALGLKYPVVIVCSHPMYSQNTIYGDRTGYGFFDKVPFYMRILKVTDPEADPEYVAETKDERKVAAGGLNERVRKRMIEELEEMIEEYEIDPSAFVM